jgi:cytochrome c-type biogenesis protein CcmH/NrfF
MNWVLWFFPVVCALVGWGFYSWGYERGRVDEWANSEGRRSKSE